MDDEDDIVADMTPIDRSILETTARIIGPNSAAAQALASADTHDGETRFFRSGLWIIVQKKDASGQWRN